MKEILQILFIKVHHFHSKLLHFPTFSVESKEIPLMETETFCYQGNKEINIASLLSFHQGHLLCSSHSFKMQKNTSIFPFYLGCFIIYYSYIRRSNFPYPVITTRGINKYWPPSPILALVSQGPYIMIFNKIEKKQVFSSLILSMPDVTFLENGTVSY